jgi:hypothetical protein
VIIQDETKLTAAVLAETERAGDPRVKEITQELVRHLRGSVREVRLTKKEFDTVIDIAAKAVSSTGADCTEVKGLGGRAFGGQAMYAASTAASSGAGPQRYTLVSGRGAPQPGHQVQQPESSFCGTAWTRSP